MHTPTPENSNTLLQILDAAPKPEPKAAMPPLNLLDAYLTEQQDLTAVERFSRFHDRHETPARAPYYRSLIPLSTPGPGQQYSFEVDLDRCSGCKACVTAAIV